MDTCELTSAHGDAATEFSPQFNRFVQMTSLIAWSGADTHGTASIYFASDSRISWDKLGKRVWDTAPKVLASTTQPEIFGFTGYALLPYVALSQACMAIDRGLRGAQDEKSPDGKCDWLWNRIKTQTKMHPSGADHSFNILYAIRTGSKAYISRKGKEPPAYSPDEPKATFDLYVLSWDASSEKFSEKHYGVPHSESSILKLSGTGETHVRNAHNVWEKSPGRGTSRSMFSALCLSLETGNDPQSGGAPQLVGMYRKGNGRTFGVFTSQGAFFQGVRFSDHPGDSVEWRDQLFRRVEFNGRLLDGARSRSSDSEWLLNPMHE